MTREPGGIILAASCCWRIVSNCRMRRHLSETVRLAIFATAGQYAAIRTSVSSAYEMLGFSICSLLMRSFISLATSTLSLEVTSLICKSERRLGTAPGPISGQSRPAVWPRAGRQPRTPLKRSMNAIRFQRGDDAEMVSGSRTAGAAATAVRNILHLQPTFDLYSAAPACFHQNFSHECARIEILRSAAQAPCSAPV